MFVARLWFPFCGSAGAGLLAVALRSPWLGCRPVCESAPPCPARCLLPTAAGEACGEHPPLGLQKCPCAFSASLVSPRPADASLCVLQCHCDLEECFSPLLVSSLSFLGLILCGLIFLMVRSHVCAPAALCVQEVLTVNFECFCTGLGCLTSGGLDFLCQEQRWVRSGRLGGESMHGLQEQRWVRSRWLGGRTRGRVSGGVQRKTASRGRDGWPLARVNGFWNHLHADLEDRKEF